MLPVLSGIVLGAAGAFLLDPQQGRRRRALVRDKAVHGVHKGREWLDAASRDVRFRAQGATSRLRTIASSEQVPGKVLVARVRAKIGRFVSHPRAIEVTAAGDGCILVSGDVLAAEHHELLRAIESVRGVREVQDRLAVHQTAEGIASLQGGKPPPGERPEFLQRNWSPAARLASGGAGAALLVYAFSKGGLLGVAALATGAALLARTGTNRPLASIVNSDAGSRRNDTRAQTATAAVS